jgi:N-acetylneuraminate synthase
VSITTLPSTTAITASRQDRATGTELRIGSHVIAAGAPAFLIAEIGINHNGSVTVAKQLVDAAVSAGADCAKFQMRDLSSLYRNHGDADDSREDLGSQYTLDLLTRFSLTDRQMYEVFDYCRSRGITPLCTPWDLTSVRSLERYGMPAYKLASADLTNHELLHALARTGKPLLISTGMSTEEEILESVGVLRSEHARFVLLHCNSTYPAPFKDVNLRYLDRLAELGGGLVGYSGHERGYHVAVAAVARGARVIEKHLTLDRDAEGNDHKVSLLPDEFAEMVGAIRQVEDALGTSAERTMTQGEKMNRVTLAKSVVIARPGRKGEIIRPDMLAVKSPGRGLQPNRMGALVGKPLPRDMDEGDFFYPSDVESSVTTGTRREFHFSRPWGVAVRYHDYKSIARFSNLDFLEFHMSFKDLDLGVAHVFDRPLDLDLIVHSPDLFAGDHILDLANADARYRARSITELQRVIDRTLEIQPYFTGCTTPRVVVSLGGFSADAPIAASERERLYDRVISSLGQLDATGVTVLAQTLPPFPWYRGGQLFCNLFVDPEDTAQFARASGTKICFDVAHSQLAANHRGRSLSDFVSVLGSSIGHLHVVDAEGVDGEGLQIGEGDVDFDRLAADLDRFAPGVSFIPEIWQGHVNDGEGFWVALERLEQWFA